MLRESMVRWLESLKSDLHNRPKRFALKVGSVCIVVALIPMVFLHFVETTSGPYPSEKTPLSLIGNGVKWTQKVGLTSTYQMSGVGVADNTGEADWYFAGISRNRSSPAVYDLGSRRLGNLTLSLNLTDRNGNGLYDKGDFFTLTLPSSQIFASDTVYRVDFLYDVTPILENGWTCNFALHSSHFYTWGYDRIYGV